MASGNGTPDDWGPAEKTSKSTHPYAINHPHEHIVWYNRVCGSCYHRLNYRIGTKMREEDMYLTTPMEEWVDSSMAPGLTKELNERLSQALKVCERERLFPDGIKPVSNEQAIMCWRIIEEIRTIGFPEELEIVY